MKVNPKKSLNNDKYHLQKKVQHFCWTFVCFILLPKADKFTWHWYNILMFSFFITEKLPDFLDGFTLPLGFRI